MDTLVSTSLIDFIKNYLTDEQIGKLEETFKSYELLEVARLKSAYSMGRLDYALKNDSDSETYINNKYNLK